MPPTITAWKASSGRVHIAAGDGSLCRLAKGKLTHTREPITCGLCKNMVVAQYKRAKASPSSAAMKEAKRLETKLEIMGLQVPSRQVNVKPAQPRAKGYPKAVEAAAQKPASADSEPQPWTRVDGTKTVSEVNAQTVRGDVRPIIQVRGIAYEVLVYDLKDFDGYMAIWVADMPMIQATFRTLTWRLTAGPNDAHADMYADVVRTVTDLVISDVRAEFNRK